MPTPRAVAVVAARLNSSRLPGKQLLPLAGQPLIARLFQRLESVTELDTIVLATTEDPANHPLIEWAQIHNKNLLAYQGDVDDVAGRLDAAVKAWNADIVVHICGDSPLVEPATLSRQIRALREHPDADTAWLAPPSSGDYIHEGFAVYRRHFWDKLIAASITETAREHVGIAHSQAGRRRAITVPEDPIFEFSHRISVDTPADYYFMEEVYRRWYTHHDEKSIVSLRWVIEQLQDDPSLAAINGHVRQRRPNQVPLHAVIVTAPSRLSRGVALARALTEYAAAGVNLMIVGAHDGTSADLALLPRQFFTGAREALVAAQQHAATEGGLVIVDLPDLRPALKTTDRKAGVPWIGIDVPSSLAPAFHSVFSAADFHPPESLIRHLDLVARRS